MSELKRKYDVQMTTLPEKRLGPKPSDGRNHKEKASLSKNKKKQVFQPQMIYEIIERIKDL
jgi:hypothetical protein